ncbi:MAG: hypothetical protein ACYSUD_15830, partial [Planctomycetota bacterium]
MSNCRVMLKSRFRWYFLVLVGIAVLATLSCRVSREVDPFYLRSRETGRLVGPIHLTSGHPLPLLDKGAYVVARPAEFELATRKLLLEAKLYESHHFDNDVDEVIETIRQMLKHRIGEKAPTLRVEDVDALITMDIGADEPAYDVLLRIAAKAKARVFIKDGAVVLSRKRLTELTNLDATTSEAVATT